MKPTPLKTMLTVMFFQTVSELLISNMWYESEAVNR